MNTLWHYLTVFGVSALPVLELRGGLILAGRLGLPLVWAFIICVLGTMFPTPFILLFFKFIVNKFKRTKYIGKYLRWLNNKVTNQAKKLGKLEYIGLMIFVAIPLPGTGAWTASMISSVLGMRIKYSLIAIALGVIESAIIMSIISYGLLDYIINYIN